MLSEEIMSKEAFEELIRNLEIVASLTLYGRKSIKYWVTKLQKENKELKSKNKHLKSENNAYGNEIVRQNLEIVEKDRYIKNSEEITTEMNNDIKKLLLENKQKDKQIDLMVEKIYKRISAKELNKYCNKQKNNCKNYKECFNCIKQYFENKAKGE